MSTEELWNCDTNRLTITTTGEGWSRQPRDRCASDVRIITTQPMAKENAPESYRPYATQQYEYLYLLPDVATTSSCSSVGEQQIFIPGMHVIGVVRDG
jgi:hypothetical protein